MALPLAAAQFDLESALSASRGGANAASIDRQLDRLAQLQRQLGTANPAALATLRGEIGAAVAQTQALVQQARDEAAGAAAGDSPDIVALADRAQSQAASFMRDLHQYDALLQFDSAEDRAAYEQREAERRRRYEEELAKGTPEGKFNASGEALGQMADLAANGGSADPALMQRMDELADSLSELRAQYLREGKTAEVEAFDQRRREDLRAIMASKGHTDAQIDAFLAAHPDPIKATRQFVKEHGEQFTAKDLDGLDNKEQELMARATPSNEIATTQAIVSLPPGADADEIGNAVADLKAMGLVIASFDDEPHHGVSADSATPALRSTARI